MALNRRVVLNRHFDPALSTRQQSAAPHGLSRARSRSGLRQNVGPRPRTSTRQRINNGDKLQQERGAGEAEGVHRRRVGVAFQLPAVAGRTQQHNDQTSAGACAPSPQNHHSANSRRGQRASTIVGSANSGARHRRLAPNASFARAVAIYDQPRCLSGRTATKRSIDSRLQRDWIGPPPPVPRPRRPATAVAMAGRTIPSRMRQFRTGKLVTLDSSLVARVTRDWSKRMPTLLSSDEFFALCSAIGQPDPANSARALVLLEPHIFQTAPTLEGPPAHALSTLTGSQAINAHDLASIHNESSIKAVGNRASGLAEAKSAVLLRAPPKAAVCPAFASMAAVSISVGPVPAAPKAPPKKSLRLVPRGLPTHPVELPSTRASVSTQPVPDLTHWRWLGGRLETGDVVGTTDSPSNEACCNKHVDVTAS